MKYIYFFYIFVYKFIFVFLEGWGAWNDQNKFRGLAHLSSGPGRPAGVRPAGPARGVRRNSAGRPIHRADNSGPRPSQSERAPGGRAGALSAGPPALGRLCQQTRTLHLESPPNVFQVYYLVYTGVGLTARAGANGPGTLFPGRPPNGGPRSAEPRSGPGPREHGPRAMRLQSHALWRPARATLQHRHRRTRPARAPPPPHSAGPSAATA